MKSFTAILFSAALVFTVASCGKDAINVTNDGDAGTDAGSDGGVNDGGVHDGGSDAGSHDGGAYGDGGQTLPDGGTCTASADYGTVTPINPTADYAAPPADYYEYITALGPGATPDALHIELWNQLGVFANGVVPGTYTLSGDELDYGTCGLCVLIYTDTDASGAPTDLYFATGGTVTITQVVPVLTGTVSHLTFTHVDIDPSTAASTPVGDGCDSAIDSLAFATNVDGAPMPGVCTATASYGTVTPIDPVAAYDSGYDVYEYQAQLNNDAAFDYLDLQLWNGLGVFANGVVPGSYVLSGDDLNYGTCGLCVLIFTDTDSTGTPTDAYFATGGTVTITQVSPVLTGTLTNMTFTHVNIDPTTAQSTPAGDGCDSAIDSLAFATNVDGAPVTGACTAATDYGTVTPINPTADYVEPPDDYYEYVAGLDSDTLPDQLHIELWNGLGVFTNGVVPGNYTLSGDELDYSTCGLCLYIATDVDPTAGVTDYYFATGGTVNITQVKPVLTGSLANVTFTHFLVDSSGNLVNANDGCDSKIDALSFATAMTIPACTATAAYGTVVPTAQTANFTESNYQVYEYDANLNADARPDVLDVRIFTGQGIFAAGIQPGTYPLTGNEVDFSACDLCVGILTDTDGTGAYADYYFATGGSVTITSVTPTLAGSLDNVTFTHLVQDSSGGYISSPDGCAATLTHVDFSAPVIYPACATGTTYATVTPQNPDGYYDSTAAGTGYLEYQYFADLNTDAAPDDIDLELYAAGIFANGVKTGTFQLSGDELQYKTCGLCLLFLADNDPNNGPAGIYMATGGTVTITSLHPTLSGTITNATFTQVTIASDGTSTPTAADPCSASVTSLAFTYNVGTGTTNRTVSHAGKASPHRAQIAGAPRAQLSKPTLSARHAVKSTTRKHGRTLRHHRAAKRIEHARYRRSSGSR